MARWEKQGKVFDPKEMNSIDWLNEYAQAPCVLPFDTFIRVYFSGRPIAEVSGQYVSYTGYVDLDKTDFFKVLNVSKEPVLSLGKKGCFDEFGVYPFSVIREGEKVIAYYGGWTRCASVPFNVAIGMAISNDDGKTFERVGNGPVLSYSHDEPFILSGPKIRKFGNTYYLFYIAGKKWKLHNGRQEPVYHIRMATSVDGYEWKKFNKDLIEVRIEEDECQASPDVFYQNGMYHMFFCYRNSVDYRQKQGGYRIGYAKSYDLLTWERDDSLAGIDVSYEGWDEEMVAYPHVFESDGSVYMFYLGNGVGRYGFGVALLKSNSL
jgi:hypothetical protein